MSEEIIYCITVESDDGRWSVTECVDVLKYFETDEEEWNSWGEYEREDALSEIAEEMKYNAVHVSWELK